MNTSACLERCLILARAQILVVAAYGLCAWFLFSPLGYSSMRWPWPASWIDGDRTRVENFVWGNADEIVLEFGELATAEQQHFADTRQFVHRLRQGGGPLLVVAAAIAFLTKRQALLATVRAAMISALVFSAGMSLWALLGWGGFFAFAHEILFRSGTWQFPHGAYSLVLFPRAFWIEAAFVWLLLPCCLLGACARILPRVSPEPA